METRSLRLILLLALGLSIPALPAVALAQTGDDEEDVEPVETEPGDDEEPRLRAPTLAPIDVSGADEEEPVEEDAELAAEAALAEEELAEEEIEEEEIEEEEEEIEEEVVDDELPSPGAADDRLDVAGDPTVEPWTSPQTVFELHGYMRMRGEFQDQYSLGRSRAISDEPDLPFELFIPREDAGSPGSEARCAGMTTGPCNQRALAFANMRLRLEPTVHLSDDVRVRMQLDVFDNLVLGSTPDGYAYNPTTGVRRFSNAVPLTAFSQTQIPSSAGINSWTDSIVVRRAWAEVRNRGLGELRFGRMGNHWGLGLLANGGDGIDSDWQSDVDRIMAITRLVGFYFFGAWDFASEGFIYDNPVDRRVPFDAVRNDDVDQFTFGIARRSTAEEQQAALQRGDFVLNGGLYFVYRTQNLSSYGTRNPLDPDTSPTLFRRGFEVFVPDVWVQFLYENLRLEAEAVMMIGTIDNMQLDDPMAGVGSPVGPTHQILNFGVAFEGEYHLLNNQLGIYFYTGYASGDADVEMSQGGAGPIHAQNARFGGAPDTSLSALSFHPNYRIDLIFWRTIMRQFGGAYYFRPGLSYDFIRSSFGQLLGARADVIWSRASEPVQTWGNQADIGVEIDVQAYYRSEDGPDLLDGFYASIQWGIFFPLAGVGYLPDQMPTGPYPGGQNAMTLRLLLGVQY